MVQDPRRRLEMLRLAGGFAVGWFALAAAHGAEIIEAADPLCRLQLTGPIETGDADRLSDLLYPLDLSYERLCLDSPGGSFMEAVALAEMLYRRGIVTVVGDGMACLGACGFVFMGGHEVEWVFSTRVLGARDDWPPPERILHAGGTLSFAVTAGADDHAGDTLAAIRRLLTTDTDSSPGAPLVSPDLMALAILATSETPLLVDTIDKARRWGIEIAPVESDGNSAFTNP